MISATKIRRMRTAFARKHGRPPMWDDAEWLEMFLPTFDALTPGQEQLAAQFAAEVGTCCPVRILEIAEALAEVEVKHD